MKKYVACGVPMSNCEGASAQLSSSISGKLKVHGSHKQAFKCYEKYLLSLGFKKIGNREYEDPETHVIRVLTKKSRFGGLLRTGKSGEGATKRAMPEDRTGGLIIRC